jgi:hypothetical protein
MNPGGRGKCLDRTSWHECSGLRSATRTSGFQPYRAGSYRGTRQSLGLARRLCMPSGAGGGMRRELVCLEGISV